MYSSAYEGLVSPVIFPVGTLIVYMTGHSPKADVAGHGDSDGLSLDVVCELLANQRRQYVLACLLDHREAIAMTDLAEDVAIRENERPFTEIPKEAVRSIATSLYHVHIPKLVDAGAVVYDQERDLVRVSETVDLVERVLSLAADGEEKR